MNKNLAYSLWQLVRTAGRVVPTAEVDADSAGGVLICSGVPIPDRENGRDVCAGCGGDVWHIPGAPKKLKKLCPKCGLDFLRSQNPLDLNIGITKESDDDIRKLFD